ncbi:MAG: hypothetical protein HC860_18320 [Alkalinema sp. RU_4_3]|nr:hypothetical protein [Alkalinema sp. RU_4_3]
MKRRLDEFLKSATVLISCDHADTESKKLTKLNIAAAGFCFAPGLILTCIDGVKTSHDGLVQVGLPRDGKIQWLPAQVQEVCPEISLAIVMLLDNVELEAVYLDQGSHRGDRAYSYDTTGPTPSRFSLVCEAVSQDSSGLIRLRGDRSGGQLGGAPLFNQRTGAVCGILLPQRLGGDDYHYDAVPLHQLYQKFPALAELQASVHGAHSTWTPLLEKRTEALPSDWRYFDRDWQPKRSYLQAGLLLAITYCQWRSLKPLAGFVQATQSIKHLLKALRRGKLGQELQQQHEKLLWRFLLQVEPRRGGQAALIYELEAQALLLSQLMSMLMVQTQDGASLARLSWSRDVLNEQRTILASLKHYSGNTLPQVEAWQQRLGVKPVTGDLELYDRILGNLLSRHVAPEEAPPEEGRPQMTALAWEGITPVPETSIDDLLQNLDREIARYPQLTMLRKFQLLLEAYGRSAQAPEMVIHPYRAWSEAGAYHSHPDCKFYPDPKTPEEFAKIIHYSDRNEAEGLHRHCKLCSSIEQSVLAGTYGKPSSTKTTPKATDPTVSKPVKPDVLETPELIHLDSVSTKEQGELSGELRVLPGGEGPVDPRILARNISRLSAYITDPEKVKAAG